MVEWIYPVILIAAGLVVVSTLTSVLAFRFGAPLLFIFLAIGLLAGEEGLGIQFDDASTAYLIGSLALAVILFDSGFRTRLRTFRQAAAPAITLAILGVLLTTGLVGVAAHYILGLPPVQALLMGAIISSTDAAAVFFLLRVGGITIQERVRSTLEIESGSNDPMAIFLTITLVELIITGSGIERLPREFLTGFGLQMGLGILFGVVGGYLIFRLVRIELETGLYPVVVLGAAICLFALAGFAGGSGFLAAYVAGLVAGDRYMRSLEGLRRFQDGMTWLAQIAMFLTLGLLAKPSEFSTIALPAIALALFLTFVARPVSIWLCLLPFGYRRNEIAFIGWVGLRGAVSILLAILPFIGALKQAQLFFNVAFIVVLTSLLVQGWTIRFMAHWLGLIVPPRSGPVGKVELELPGTSHHELVVYHVVADSPVLSGKPIPRWARPSRITRNGHSLRFCDADRLQAGDCVYIFTAPQYAPFLDQLFASPARIDTDDSKSFAEVKISPHARLATLRDDYAIAIPPEESPARPIGEFIQEQLGGRVEIGDLVSCGEADLIVKELDTHGMVIEVALIVHR